MTRTGRCLLLAVALLGTGGTVRATGVFDGDPVDPATGRAYAILPGVPLILPQADGKFGPPSSTPAPLATSTSSCAPPTSASGPSCRRR